jgi:nischarin
VIGNTSSKFIEQRREELQKYLQTILVILQKHMPSEFVHFLDFHKYDVIFLLQNLALDVYRNGEKYLFQNDRKWTFTIIELHAITHRLHLPCPQQELQDSKFDFSHILDFCTQLTSLRITPTRSTPCDTKDDFLHELVTPIGTSNILVSTLNLELSPFNALKSLEFVGIVPMNVDTNARVRENVESFTVNFTRAQTIQNILNPESIHTNFVTDEKWTNLRDANFAFNDIWQLDAALKLIPNVENLILDGNRLRSVANMRQLHKLSFLSLNNNLIEDVSGWFAELGNIQTLNLAGNKISKLAGLSKLRSIRSLDLSCNLIGDFEEVEEVAALPVLEILGLNGNPVALEVDYRARVIARFDERGRDVILDNEKCSQGEIDKAMVLAALRKSRTSVMP